MIDMAVPAVVTSCTMRPIPPWLPDMLSNANAPLAGVAVELVWKFNRLPVSPEFEPLMYRPLPPAVRLLALILMAVPAPCTSARTGNWRRSANHRTWPRS